MASRIYHSDEEWRELITKSRQSGFSDADWCRQNGISTSTFYNAVTRLRKKACSFPEPVKTHTPGKIFDLTSACQDVVPIRIEGPEDVPSTEVSSVRKKALSHLDNSHSIEILLGSTCIRLSNDADPSLVSAVLTSLGRQIC